jgi:hypothetical protein
LFHYTYTGLEHQINRINNYSTLTSSYKSAQYSLNSLPFRLWLVGTIIIRPLLRFARFYLIRGGFLYGTAGLIVATNDAFYVFLKYAKLWELAEKARSTQDARIKVRTGSSLNPEVAETRLPEAPPSPGITTTRI